MMNLQVFIIFIFCTYSVSHAAIKLDVTPSNIEHGFTNTFTVHCSVTNDSSANKITIVSINISRTNSTTVNEFKELASVTMFGGDPFEIDTENATVSGGINITGGSYLRMEWRDPSSERAGNYKCVGTGIDVLGHHYESTSIATVTVEEPDVELFDQEVQEILQMQECLESLKSSPPIADIEETKQSLFETPSSLYNGARYFLSKRDYSVGIYQAQARCQLYGGYLAEIDDSLEWNFVYSYLKTFSGLGYVVIDGTDEVHEGVWVSTRTKVNLKFFNWGTGEPNNGASANCIYCNNDKDFKWEDGGCINGGFIRYLCEIKELHN